MPLDFPGRRNQSHLETSHRRGRASQSPGPTRAKRRPTGSKRRARKLLHERGSLLQDHQRVRRNYIICAVKKWSMAPSAAQSLLNDDSMWQSYEYAGEVSIRKLIEATRCCRTLRGRGWGSAVVDCGHRLPARSEKVISFGVAVPKPSVAKSNAGRRQNAALFDSPATYRERAYLAFVHSRNHILGRTVTRHPGSPSEAPSRELQLNRAYVSSRTRGRRSRREHCCNR